MINIKKKTSHATGMLAEEIAAWGLRVRGYRIVARRYKTKFGEIDLVARRGKVLAFIEVKARGDIGAALESVTPRMRQRIGMAARWYLSAHPQFAEWDVRFDIIALAPPFYWQHLDNAFQPLA